MNHLLKSINAYIVFAGSAIIYVLTCCRTVYVGDSGELILALTTGGIAHPPGYPLYTILGFLWLKLFFFLGPALATNLFSAAAASSGTVVLYLLLQSINTDDIPSAANAGLALLYAFSYPVWSSATNAEVYAFSGLLYLLALYAIVGYYLNGGKKSAVRALFFTGLVLTHHFSSGVIVAGLVLAMFFRKKNLNPKSLAVAAFCFCCPLIIYLYLYIRFDPKLPVNWMDEKSMLALWRMISGKAYRQFVGIPHIGDMFLFFYKTAAVSFRYFGPGIILLSLPGLVIGLKRNLRLASLFLLPAALNILIVPFYRIPDYQGYLLPFLVTSVIFIQMLFSRLWAKYKFYKTGMFAVIILIVLIPIISNYSKCDISRFDLAGRYGRDLLYCAPSWSMLFLKSDNGSHTALYLHHVEQIRPDLEVYSSSSTLSKLKHRFASTDYDLIMDSLERSEHKIYWGAEYIINQGMSPSRASIMRRGLLCGPSSGDGISGIIQRLNQFAGETLPRIDLKADLKAQQIFLEYRLYWIDVLLSAGLRDKAAEAIVDLNRWGRRLDDPHTCLAVAQFFRVRNMTDQSRVWIELALATRPFSYVEKDIYICLGTVFRQNGDLNAATRVLERALRIDPDDLSARYNINLVKAEMAVGQKDWQAALRFFGELTRLEPENPLPYFNMAVVYERLPGGLSDALTHYKKFLSLAAGRQPMAERRARDRIAELEVEIEGES